MSKTLTLYSRKLGRSLKKLLTWLWRKFTSYWRKNWWHKTIVVFLVFICFVIGAIWGIGRWYIWSERNQPLNLGASFIPDYAESLGLNPEQAFSALVNDLHIKNFRLVSYWSDIKPSPGQYNFSQLDSEFATADAAHAHITLTLGLRQPGWPECHPPNWVNTAGPISQWQPQLEQFMTTVINRYKHNPALANYQLENEYFLKGFGTCNNQTRERFVSEDNLVQKLDSAHPIIIGRSNNALGFPVGQPQPDEFSISIYRRVWDGNFSHRYLEYPQPSWLYAFLAGVQKIFLHKNMIIGELQAEPWPPHGQTIPQVNLAEQNKSFNAKRFQDTIKFGEATGMKTIYFWGAEYWYYRLTVLHDPDVWNVAKQAFAQTSQY